MPTPTFRALATGEFMESQIFNWTYQDEQARKEAVGGTYLEMPTMVMNPAPPFAMKKLEKLLIKKEK